MIRNRTTVKPKPGLFLQPFVVAQLSGTLIEAVVEGSEVTASEYAGTSWLGVVGGATPTDLARDLYHRYVADLPDSRDLHFIRSLVTWVLQRSH